MRVYVLLAFLSMSLFGQSQTSSYAEHIANLAILIEENPEDLRNFRDSVICTSPVPIHHPKFQGLVDAYMDWARLPMKQDFRAMATNFKNDTLNQYGFIKYLKEAFTNGEMDTVRYLQLTDSIFQVSLHESFSEMIRNQNFRLRVSNRVPDFNYPLMDGESYLFSQAKEQYLLLEFPLPKKYDDPSLRAENYFEEYDNLKILRVSAIPEQFKKMNIQSFSMFPSDLDVTIYRGDPIDEFFKIRSSPRWLLINKKLEVISRDLDLKNAVDREKLESLLKLSQ